MDGLGFGEGSLMQPTKRAPRSEALGVPLSLRSWELVGLSEGLLDLVGSQAVVASVATGVGVHHLAAEKPGGNR